ncbi:MULTISPECIES: signal recognition particle protein [Nitrosomonas]|uniref:Signal recognition particle protein n=1 Tax=Nitrosomonas communis TaxID=44574 RepID=A0A0F7KJL3_9PROT|nr:MULTISPECIES: signal recognition particle protein [Nitrosomonas]AKH38967.1 signal recognition particle [Nitrosomonas communis]TYP81936.1 signal recognition particle subunit SRP54 [Nitrosomonas communis]UVS61121.1 signal recognition particle protein [Nitrosomonas sp. PLL12]
MFDNLTSRLSGVIKSLRGEARLTESNIQAAMREVRMALLEADVALPVIKDFIERVKQKAIGREVMESLSPGQALVGVVHQELMAIMGGEKADLNLNTVPPAVILMAGLQGAGKTTSSGKLAKWLIDNKKKKVMLVSCDIYRPAAIDQLELLSSQVGADFFPVKVGQQPAAICVAALDYARKHHHDIIIVDTAGRLGIDQAMMDEITELEVLLKPIETLFVVDAMQGQDAVNTAKAFADALPLTGVILTKLDGDARGGAALSVRHVTGKPIKFTGVAEKLTGLEPFYPDRMASRILGMGDVLGLIEEAQRSADQKEAEKLMKKMKSGKGFDLDDFKMQFQQMKKMGGMSAMLDKLPHQLTQAAQNMKVDDKIINRTEGIINAMTREERAKPELIKASRKRRIAVGSGVSVQEVNRLLSQFEQARKMMKMVNKGGMAKMMRAVKGMLPQMR